MGVRVRVRARARVRVRVRAKARARARARLRAAVEARVITLGLDWVAAVLEARHDARLAIAPLHDLVGDRYAYVTIRIRYALMTKMTTCTHYTTNYTDQPNHTSHRAY